MTPLSKTIHLIYPHQLFEEVCAFSAQVHCILIEDPLFFGDATYPRRFHQQKLVLHRASMRKFADRLRKSGKRVTYMAYASRPDPDEVMKFVKEQAAEEVTAFDPTDDILERRIKTACRRHAVSILFKESPNFLTPMSVNRQFFAGKKTFLMRSYYQFQRRRLGILVDAHGRPEGGKWSFDTENRKRLPADAVIPPRPSRKTNEYVSEAIVYVQGNFSNNPGRAEDFQEPIDHGEARTQLTEFIHHRLARFGAYEDAIAKNNETGLFHSRISASLNIGLLSPQEVVREVLAVKSRMPLPSIEGFVRQVIGWREFIRAAYVLRGVEMRTRNALHHARTMPETWYTGNTGIEPLDRTIQKVLRHAYCHHIERLMILGNFLLLTQTHPDEVYGWFMDVFIDAYDWVMVPNVYGMSQFADGGGLTTKPYFSSSNYLLKMSDFRRGPWCEIWDDLFYDFCGRIEK